MSTDSRPYQHRAPSASAPLGPHPRYLRGNIVWEPIFPVDERIPIPQTERCPSELMPGRTFIAPQADADAIEALQAVWLRNLPLDQAVWYLNPKLSWTPFLRWL